MPSSSPRSSAYPTLASKLPFYESLRKLLNYLRNDQLNQFNRSEFIFPPTLKKNQQRIKSYPQDGARCTEQKVEVTSIKHLNNLLLTSEN